MAAVTLISHAGKTTSSTRISKRVLGSLGGIASDAVPFNGPAPDDESYHLSLDRFAALVIAGFGFRRSFPRKWCLGFRRLLRISSGCPRDLAANFAKTNGEGDSSEKPGVEEFVSESKDCVEVSPNKSSTVMKLTSFGRK
ncbi:hypothetical protein AVEN_150088-1 [Araneus ventricosus]|uniref:Uncharacterized protein n=1 Tax=Araneus ventricosus TaxID=182803 RepID=A0A4Y2DEH6_ARAVE|nr:hypothetical protein AVEN_150088-1 [Araneus ventricosus]